MRHFSLIRDEVLYKWLLLDRHRWSHFFSFVFVHFLLFLRSFVRFFCVLVTHFTFICTHFLKCCSSSKIFFGHIFCSEVLLFLGIFPFSCPSHHLDLFIFFDLVLQSIDEFYHLWNCWEKENRGLIHVWFKRLWWLKYSTPQRGGMWDFAKCLIML